MFKFHACGLLDCIQLSRPWQTAAPSVFPLTCAILLPCMRSMLEMPVMEWCTALCLGSHTMRWVGLYPMVTAMTPPPRLERTEESLWGQPQSQYQTTSVTEPPKKAGVLAVVEA